MKKVYIFLADGFEEIEALTVVDLLRRADIDIKTISLNNDKSVVGRSSIFVIADEVFDKNKDYIDGEALVLPGGAPGYINIKNHRGAMEIVNKFYDNKKFLCAICAAPTILGEAGLLKDKTAVCYPDMEKDLFCSKIGKSGTIKDGNIITSKGVGTAIDFSLKIIECILDKETADKVKVDIIY